VNWVGDKNNAPLKKCSLNPLQIMFHRVIIMLLAASATHARQLAKASLAPLNLKSAEAFTVLGSAAVTNTVLYFT
jgi:hypothetical protein